MIPLFYTQLHDKLPKFVTQTQLFKKKCVWFCTYNDMFFFDMSYDGRSPCSLHLTLITAITNTTRCLILISALTVHYVM